jgi:hypothetical protein
MNSADAHYPLSWRSGLGLLLALASGLASGPFITTNGFGLIPFVSTANYGPVACWLLCAAACPLLVGLMTDRWHFFLSPLASVLMSTSVEYRSYRWHQQHHKEGPWAYMQKDIGLDISMAVAALIFSFFIAYAIHKNRRA